MTGISHIDVQPERSPALWSAALSLGIVVVVMVLTAWLSGHLRISQWRIPDAEIRWITPGAVQLPRHPSEGQAIHELGELRLGDPSPVQMFFRNTGRPGSDVPMAILASGLDGQAQAFANFVPVPANTKRSGAGLARSSARSQVWGIPDDHIYPGENRFDIVVKGSVSRALSGPIYFGPKEELETVAQWGIRSTSAAQQVVLVLCGLAIVIGIAAATVGLTGRHLAATAAFASASARIILSQTGVAATPLWPAIDPVLLAMIAIAAGLAIRDGEHAAKWTERLTIALVVAAGLSGTGVLIAANVGADRTAALLGVLTALIGLAFLVWALVEAIRSADEDPIGQQPVNGAVAGLCLAGVIIVVCAIVGMGLPISPVAADIGLAFVMSALAVVAIGRGVRDVVLGMRTRLDNAQTIRRQQVALEKAARALSEQTHQSAMLEERQRMARDVHDGIGGQLASLIAQVRMRRISMDDVEQSLVGGLSELRLLVASLDVMGETLADAMATFQERARQQAAAAGMTLDWNQSDDLAAEIRDQRWLLNLYRLMQEAITNAIRHSGGDRITVAVSHTDGDSIIVQIADNGSGFDQGMIKPGRGLSNLQHRAKDLHGEISIIPSPTGRGTLVRLQAPLPR